MNYRFFICIPMFSSCLNVFFLLTLSLAFSMLKKIAVVFYFLLNSSKIFVIILNIESIVLPCFLKPNYLSSIFLFFSKSQTSLLFVTLSNVLQTTFLGLPVCPNISWVFFFFLSNTRFSKIGRFKDIGVSSNVMVLIISLSI